MDATIIIPFHRNLAQLARSLPAGRRSLPTAEILVVADVEKRRGPWFAVRVVPAHVLYHLCNGVSFAAGAIAHLGARMGIRVPGALPVSDWT